MSYNMMLNILTGLSILLMTLGIGTSFVLGWYVRKVSEKLKYAVQRHSEISVSLNEFVEHIEVVNKMELYSGDEVLVNLLKHSRAMSEEIGDYTNMIDAEEEFDEEEE